MVSIVSVLFAVAFATLAKSCPVPLGCGGAAPVFPVALDNCGPAPLPLPALALPPQATPVIEKPVIPLPAAIPAPRTIGNVCNCVKTIVKPQVYQQIIAVPSVQRYLQTTHTPVVENINYHAVPVNCPPNAPEGPIVFPVGPCGPIAPSCFPCL